MSVWVSWLSPTVMSVTVSATYAVRVTKRTQPGTRTHSLAQLFTVRSPVGRRVGPPAPLTGSPRVPYRSSQHLHSAERTAQAVALFTAVEVLDDGTPREVDPLALSQRVVLVFAAVARKDAVQVEELVQVSRF